LPTLVRQHPDVVVVFACRTKTPEALTIEAAVRQQVEAAGLSAHVRFLRQVDHFESLLALATLFLFPVQSLHRKMDIPLVLLQALALGKPIVISTVGPLTELLSSGVGAGVPAGDASALSDILVTLLGDESQLTAMAVAGPALIAERYSAAQMTRAYERLYVSLVEGSRAA
jgi:phosphatidylinositol alpha-1,6-mannosyltransferase